MCCKMLDLLDLPGCRALKATIHLYHYQPCPRLGAACSGRVYGTMMN